MCFLGMSVHVPQVPQTLIFKECKLSVTFLPEQDDLFLFGLGRILGKGLLQLALRLVVGFRWSED